MIVRNGYITQLIQQYQQYFSRHYTKNTKYTVLLTYHLREQKTRIDLARNLDDVINERETATVTTTLFPVTYIIQLLDEEIRHYAKKGIRIKRHTVLNFSPITKNK